MNNKGTEPLDGKSRAAILLMSLGEAAASEVLKYIDPQEVQQVGQAMAEISNISQEQVDEVVETFALDVQQHTSLGIGSEEYLRTILDNALGPDTARGYIERILQGRNTKGLEALKWMDPEAVADLLREEQPQVIAVVLTHLSRDRAAQVLRRLPADIHGEVLIRVANLDGVRRSALTDLDEIMERRIAESRGDQASGLGGKRAAADIIHKLGSDLEHEVMDKVRAIDDALGVQIQELMFVFESLRDVDDRGMQALLREVSSDVLGVALKGADPDVQEHIYKNMSKRAASLLREDMDFMGPVRLKDVEDCQQKIVNIIRKLEDAGEIVVARGGEEELVV